MDAQMAVLGPGEPSGVLDLAAAVLRPRPADRVIRLDPGTDALAVAVPELAPGHGPSHRSTDDLHHDDHLRRIDPHDIGGPLPHDRLHDPVIAVTHPLGAH